MKIPYFAAIEGDRLVLRSASGVEAAAISRGSLILVSRLDCDVRVLPVPPLAARELPAFIRYRLRALYPGNPADTVFDYRLSGEGGERYAVVYLMRRETMERYRPYARRGRLVAADELLHGLIGKNESRTVHLVRSAYVECLRYEKGRLVESSVLRLDGRLELPARFERDLASSAESPAASTAGPASLWIEERVGDRRIVAAFAARVEAARPAVRSFAELLAGVRVDPWRRPALFRARRPHGPRAAALLSVFLAALSVGFVARYLQGGLAAYERRYEEVRSAYSRRAALLEGAAVARKEIKALEARYRSLLERRPIDVYRLLSGLAEAVEQLPAGTGRIESISLNGSAFTLEGSTADPFLLAEALAKRKGFSEVRVMQALPAAGGGPAAEGGPVRFTLSGRFDDR